MGLEPGARPKRKVHEASERQCVDDKYQWQTGQAVSARLPVPVFVLVGMEAEVRPEPSTQAAWGPCADGEFEPGSQGWQKNEAA